MRVSILALAGIMSVSASANGALADVARCSRPPFGGSVASYKSFIKNFGPLLDNPVRTLSAICNAKFDGGERTGLYNLGFTDGDIDSKDTSDLAVEVLTATKDLLDRTK